jgi:hypothetical protein
MEMPGLAEMKRGNADAGSGHAAAGAGDACQELNGAPDAGKVEKKVKQSNRQYGTGGIQQLFLIFFQILQNSIHNHTCAERLNALL